MNDSGFIVRIPASASSEHNKYVRTDRARLRSVKVWGCEMSRDPGRQLGAMVVAADGRASSLGYNGFASGVPDTPENWSRPRKYSLVIHAEENAVDNAPFPIVDGSVYCVLRPCHRCLNKLINNRVTRIVWFGDQEPFAGEDREIWEYLAEVFVRERNGVLLEYEPQPVDIAMDKLYNRFHDGYQQDPTIAKAAIDAVKG